MCPGILDCCKVLNTVSIEFGSIVSLLFLFWGLVCFDSMHIVVDPEGLAFSVCLTRVRLLVDQADMS
jgi:hypothetical protein